MNNDKILTKTPSNNSNDEFAQLTVRIINDNRNSYEKHWDYINKIKLLDRDTFVVELPTGARRFASGLLRQVVEKIMSSITIPSASYHSDDSNEVTESIVRDAVDTCQEEGGYYEAIESKPSAFRDMLLYGDGAVRIGINLDHDYPIKFDTVSIDKIWVDKSAKVMRSKSGLRQVTRIVIIEKYDIDHARKLYPGINFAPGKIPNSTYKVQDFDETNEDSAEIRREVEVSHLWDIGGDEPVYACYIGATMAKILVLKGIPVENDPIEKIAKKFPWIWKKSKEPFIPIDFLRCFESDEGFWNYGIGHVFYKYAIGRQQLFNRLANQNLTAMSDLTVLNVPKAKKLNVLQQIRDAQEMVKNGQKGIIINDTGEKYEVSPLEAQQFNQANTLLFNEFDKELRRWGINIDAIRESQSTTATQIIAETEVQDSFVHNLINRNTPFFKFMEEATLNMIETFITSDNETAIRTSAVLPEINNVPEGAQQINPATGAPGGNMSETKIKGITLGDVADELKDKIFFIEIDTRSGVRMKDTLKLARVAGMMTMFGQDPAVAKFGLEQYAVAQGLDYKKISQSQPQVNQNGIQQQAKELMNTGNTASQITPTMANKNNLVMP